MKTKFSSSLFVIVIISLLSPALSKADYNQKSAQNFLLGSQGSGNAWVTMALAATGAEGISFDYLKSFSGASAINYEAPILAVASLGQDPKKIGANDYVAALENFYNQNQLGDPAALNDDFFGILALVASGLPISNQTIVDSKSFIPAHQNHDGGWGWSVSASSDSNDTAAAIKVRSS